MRGESVNALVALFEDQGLFDTQLQKTSKVWTAEDIPDWYNIAEKAPYIAANGMLSIEAGLCDVVSGDYRCTHYWKEKNILKAYNYGIISGIDDTHTFNASGTLTRAELCQMLYNAGIWEAHELVNRPGSRSQGFVGT